MNEYELLYIVHPRRATDDVPSVIEWVNGLVEQGGGAILSVDDWGRRRLAYPIGHELEGTYVLTTMELAPQATSAIESQLVISEDIMRHILLRDVIPFEGHERRSERAEAPAEKPPPPAAAPAEAPAPESPAQATVAEQAVEQVVDQSVAEASAGEQDAEAATETDETDEAEETDGEASDDEGGEPEVPPDEETPATAARE